MRDEHEYWIRYECAIHKQKGKINIGKYFRQENGLRVSEWVCMLLDNNSNANDKQWK